MDSRPYLDKIITSAHMPKQHGQRGYSSKTLIPDLSHTYLKTKFGKQEEPVTTPDGRLTIGFKTAAYNIVRPIYHEKEKIEAMENVCRVEHKQYLDKLLVDLEASHRDKYDRRVQHWKSSKQRIGFGDTFNSLDAPKSPPRMEGALTPISAATAGAGHDATSDTRYSEDFNDDDNGDWGTEDSKFGDAHMRGNSSSKKIGHNGNTTTAAGNRGNEEPAAEYSAEDDDFENDDDFEESVAEDADNQKSASAVNNNTIISKPESPHIAAPSASGKTRGSAASFSGKLNRDSTSSGSVLSASTARTSFTGYTGENIVKLEKKSSRMAIFNGLLDTVEPPRSPTKRFGTLSGSSKFNYK